jgi:hypothetical protein
MHIGNVGGKKFSEQKKEISYEGKDNKNHVVIKYNNDDYK